MEKMFEKIALLVFCHLIGDYVLQDRFIANSKGKYWYHMFVHCALYVFPFWFFFGWNWQLGLIFAVHFIIDPMKARWGLIGYTADQVAHYAVLSTYLFMFSNNLILSFVPFVLLGIGIIVVVYDVVENREKHAEEMRKYYESLGM